MKQISLRQGLGIFVLIFVVPGLLVVPFRAEIVAIVPLGEPTLWEGLESLGTLVIVAGLGIYAWNQRKRIQELEREVERERYQRERAVTDGGKRDE